MSIYIKGMKMPKPKLTDMVTIYDAYVLVSPNGYATIVVDNEDGLDSTEYLLKTPIQLSASITIPSENDIYEDINKSILIGKLAKELPHYWKLKKEYNNGLKYTAYMTIIPEDKEN